MIALWHGRLPLSCAFWQYGVLYMALANLAATALALGALAADLPGLVVVAIFLLPAPYIVVAVIGVWRSADGYEGPPQWAALARVATLAWGVLMVLL